MDTKTLTEAVGIYTSFLLGNNRSKFTCCEFELNARTKTYRQYKRFLAEKYPEAEASYSSKYHVCLSPVEHSSWDKYRDHLDYRNLRIRILSEFITHVEEELARKQKRNLKLWTYAMYLSWILFAIGITFLKK